MTHLPYYHGSLSAAQADEVLKDMPTGTFLIRDSSQKQYSFFNQPYTVSWVEDIGNALRRVWHTRIEYKNNRYCLEDEIDSFPSIEQLVKFYKTEIYPLSPKCINPLLASLQQMSVNTINDNNIDVNIPSLKTIYKL